MKMHVKTKDGEYVAKFDAYGFTGSQCVIYKYEVKSFMLFSIKRLRKVWDIVSTASIKAKPSDLFYVANKAIKDYEENQKDWEEWRAKK